VDPRRIPPDILLATAGLLAVWALVQTLRLALRRWQQRRRLATVRERGALGEVRAEALLRRLGFTILGRQVGVTYGIGVDGRHVAVELRADYVVAEGGLRYVAEVKTGAFAPRIETAATRRQLLEYRVAFDVDGALLVDVEAGRVRVVEFPFPGAAPRRMTWGPRLTWLLFGVGAGALTVLALRAP